MIHSQLQQFIIERIRREGPITFAEYMRMALYEPGYGYYVTGAHKMGWQGDYFTSADVSTLFANCMGRQLCRMWESLKRPAPFLVLELGAGRGDLAQGVKAWAKKDAPDFALALDYRVSDIRTGEDAINRVPTGRADEQPGRDELGPYSGTKDGASDATERRGRDSSRPHSGTKEEATDVPAPSVILSNELIDAFPAHIVEMRASKLYEIYVDAADGRLFEVLDAPGSPAVSEYLDRYSIPWRSFEDGWRAEINLDALAWIAGAAQQMVGGYILTIDYGDKAKALYTRARQRGTLLCYYRHSVNERPLLHPGEQDITAHVNFSALIDEGRRHGLRLSSYMTQARWLENMGILDELERRRMQEYAAAMTDRASNSGQVALLQWYTLRQSAAILTDPVGMGNFKVLIMRR